jgi:exopolyphosphatase/guanosine-5'-triphosphate,3'-diphosphate pyrophosphatase
MSEQRWLLIHLTPKALSKTQVNFNDLAECILDYNEEECVEFYSVDCQFGSPNKPFSKKDQYTILDKIRDWTKQLEKQNKNLTPEEQIKIQLLTPFGFDQIEGAKAILESLKSQLGLESEIFHPMEEARQSFLGFKQGLSGYRLNSRLLYVLPEKNKTYLVFGDLHHQDKIIEVDLGIQSVAESIISLRKANQLDSLALFIKANLYRFIEQARLFGRPQLVCFDETTAKLLSKAFAFNLKTQRAGVDCIQQLCNKIIDSDFQYLNNTPWVNSESLDYTSAHLILLSFLLEGLGAINCNLDTESRLKGYTIDKLLEERKLQDQFSGHKYDWRKSAHELLMQVNPINFSRSSQLALLTSKLYDSSQGWLHAWTEKDNKVLWLSGFFYSYLSQMPSETALEIIFNNIQGISLAESKLIVYTIGLASLNDFLGQSQFLDPLSPDQRIVARRMASIIQLARALDVTGRSAVQDVRFEAKPKSSDKLVLKVFPRLNAAPEMVQVGILKKAFENQFEYKLDLELANQIPTEQVPVT